MGSQAVLITEGPYKGKRLTELQAANAKASKYVLGDVRELPCNACVSRGADEADRGHQCHDIKSKGKTCFDCAVRNVSCVHAEPTMFNRDLYKKFSSELAAIAADKSRPASTRASTRLLPPPPRAGPAPYPPNWKDLCDKLIASRPTKRSATAGYAGPATDPDANARHTELVELLIESNRLQAATLTAVSRLCIALEKAPVPYLAWKLPLSSSSESMTPSPGSQ